MAKKKQTVEVELDADLVNKFYDYNDKAFENARQYYGNKKLLSTPIENLIKIFFQVGFWQGSRQTLTNEELNAIANQINKEIDRQIGKEDGKEK